MALQLKGPWGYRYQTYKPSSSCPSGSEKQRPDSPPKTDPSPVPMTNVNHEAGQQLHQGFLRETPAVWWVGGSGRPLCIPAWRCAGSTWAAPPAIPIKGRSTWELCWAAVSQIKDLREYQGLSWQRGGLTYSSDLERLKKQKLVFYRGISQFPYCSSRVQLNTSKEENKHRCLWRGTKCQHRHEKPSPWAASPAFSLSLSRPRSPRNQRPSSSVLPKGGASHRAITAFSSLAEFRSCLHNH